MFINIKLIKFSTFSWMMIWTPKEIAYDVTNLSKKIQAGKALSKVLRKSNMTIYKFYQKKIHDVAATFFIKFRKF